MKKMLRLAPVLVGLLILAACGGGDNGESRSPLTSLEPGMQTVSYALGMDMATQVGRMPGAGDPAQLQAGLREMMDGQPKLELDTCREIMQAQATGQGPAEIQNEAFETPEAQSSYAVGVAMADIVDKQFEGIDNFALCQGLADQLAGGETLMPSEEVRTVVREYQQQQWELKSEKNRAEGEKFLTENAAREGVMVTASGLQYEVLSSMDGAKPTLEDRVKAHYKGTLIDGTEFDSSYKRGEPIEFALNGVIPGWTEALQLMSVGSRYKLYIPSDLAYRERGSGPVIGPNSTLIFEVELVEIISP